MNTDSIHKRVNEVCDDLIKTCERFKKNYKVKKVQQTSSIYRKNNNRVLSKKSVYKIGSGE